MLNRATKIAARITGVHLRSLLGAAFGVAVVVALLIWNLSMIGDVLASSDEADSIETLNQEISSYESQLEVSLDYEQTLTTNITELIQTLPTKCGVVIERLTRRERVHRRETVKLLDVELDGSYQSIAKALRYIERSPLTRLDHISVKQSVDNQRLVRLTLTLEDRQT